MILNTFETYVYLAGAFAIGVLAIEVSGGWAWEENLPDTWLLPASGVCCILVAEAVPVLKP